MDSNELVDGTMHNTLEYGPVRFLKTVPDKNTVSGVCHRFKTIKGDIIYISPRELKAFLRQEE